jgi:hypothetical protein
VAAAVAVPWSTGWASAGDAAAAAQHSGAFATTPAAKTERGALAGAATYSDEKVANREMRVWRDRNRSLNDGQIQNPLA